MRMASSSVSLVGAGWLVSARGGSGEFFRCWAPPTAGSISKAAAKANAFLIRETPHARSVANWRVAISKNQGRKGTKERRTRRQEERAGESVAEHSKGKYASREGFPSSRLPSGRRQTPKQRWAKAPRRKSPACRTDRNASSRTG